MPRDRVLKKYLRDRVVITLKSGETFDGLLDEWDRNTLTFVDAHALAATGVKTRVTGELILPRDNVAYAQAAR